MSSEAGQSTPSPELSEIKQEIQVTQSGNSAKGAAKRKARDEREFEFIERSEANALKTDRGYLELEDFQAKIKQKNRWSNFLIGSIGFLIAFQSFLLVAVGLKWFDFEVYGKVLLPALLVQNLAQIVGLALIVIKAIFDKDTTK